MPTRVTSSSEALIDVILASNPKQVNEVKVFENSISDHEIIYAKLQLKPARPKPVYVTTRSFKQYNANNFQSEVAQAPWSVVLDVFDDVEDKLNAFNILFNDLLDEHAPLKTIKIRGRPNPCVTNEIRELMKTRDSWKKKAKKSKDP
ncbi:Hypothetical predicted protein [Paramuricea clavata]|uniref:Uncharacterized protein n=1 Tax=Paramuricea clavata TaxID=317549 RepID=A0A6S7G3P9_PARCT|nr:Hypothetical predicted protein [Paramuricea clavata]